MGTNDKIKEVGVNIQEKANLIWNVANTLFGAYKPHEYGLVVLPMAVIKRFHDCLLPNHDKIIETYEKVKHLQVKDGFLRSASGYKFYNTSPYTFDKLKADPENIKPNFEAFINGFSDNVIDILANMGFFTQIERMNDAGVLYQVISDFCEPNADMSPEKISAIDMGYVFENLVQRFSESYDEEAGAHFTSRDIIYLMCDMLTMNADFADSEAPAKTVYDMAMGTSQMLTCMEERIKTLDSEAAIICYGQEINPFTFGIDEKNVFFVALWLVLGDEPNIGSNSRVVEAVVGELHYRIQPVIFDDVAANLALPAARIPGEEGGAVLDNRHAPGIFQFGNAVQHEKHLSVGLSGKTNTKSPGIAFVMLLLDVLGLPFPINAERWVGYTVVKCIAGKLVVI